MPTQAEQKTTATAELTLRIMPATTQPTLTNQEVSDVLDLCRRAVVWQANTAYAVGAVVVPANRNGHRYKAVQRGTSGATEPTWSEVAEGIQSDGASTPQLVWQEDGPDWENVYDVQRAIERVCLMKAAKVAEVYSEGGDQMGQVYKQWM